MKKSNEKTPIHHHFVCLPYLNLGDTPEIDFGFAKIWNFNVLKEKYIPDQALREHVASILKNYRVSYPHGKEGEETYASVYGIGLISTDIPTRQQPDRIEKQKINDARLILFISFLARHNIVTRNVNTGHWMASSENYAPVYFSAVVGTKYMTEHTGFVVPSWHGGIEIDKNMLIRPKHIPTPTFDVDTELLNALIKLRLKHKRIFRRLMSAIEVFYESYYNSPEVSHNARILLQASAFEILLGVQNSEARKELKDYLRRVADYPEDRRFQYKSERRNGRRRIEIGTKKVMWADRFFTLRNHIAHGLVPKESEYYFGKWQRHFDIALYFFIFCLKRKIEEGLNKEIFGDDVVWKKWTDDLQIPSKMYIGFEYDHFGRRALERMIAKHNKK